MNAERGTDDTAAGQRRLDDIGFEVFIEILGNAHRPETNRLVHALLAHFEKLVADIYEFFDVLRFERCWIRRRGQKEITNQATLAHHIRGVTLVGVCIVTREPGHFAIGDFRVVIGTVVVAILHERHRRTVWCDLKTVSVQFKRSVYLRAQQAAHVGAV